MLGMKPTHKTAVWKVWRMEAVWVPSNGKDGAWEACGRRAITDTALPLNPSTDQVRDRLVSLKLLRTGFKIKIEIEPEAIYVMDPDDDQPLIELERYSL